VIYTEYDLIFLLYLTDEEEQEEGRELENYIRQKTQQKQKTKTKEKKYRIGENTLQGKSKH